MVSFCLVLLFMMSAGCSRLFVPAQKLPAPEKPAVSPVEIDKLKERSDFWREYQCKFRLRVDSKTSKFSSRAIVLVKGRHFVRFETFTPLGQTAALYVSNETGPAVLIPSEKAIFTARSPETLVRQFLGVNLPVDLFRWVLAASIPPEQFDRIESRPYAGGAWLLISKAEWSNFEWQISAGKPALQGLIVHMGDIVPQVFRVSYDPPVELTKEAVPGKILIFGNDWNMEITVEDLKAAPQFQPSSFYMPQLPDMRKVDLDNIK